ncbi:MAG: Na+/H+ antiporter NhaA [Sphingomonadaceae bacterium]
MLDHVRHPLSLLTTRLRRLLHGEAGAGVLLMLAALLAMALANSPAGHAWHALLHMPLGWSPIPHLSSLHAWVNDGLMALFFFTVGLEIKREVIAGELSTPAQRRLPVLAAALGMAVPALIYLALTRQAPALHRGWAIPTATDIAFAIGVLSLLAGRFPPALRLFLLTVAIVDDLGAVAIIALAYTAELHWAWLALAASILAALALAARFGVRRPWVFALGGAVLWYVVLHSGVHATVAGVAAALCVPLGLDRRGESPLLRMEHVLAPVSAYLVVPVFALVNAGVDLPDLSAGRFDLTLPLAIALGLALGKLAGIFGAIWAAERLGFARRPEGASWLQVCGLALLCGIGFTMSLFIAQLAFPANPALVEQAKLGILVASLVTAALGYAVLRLAR